MSLLSEFREFAVKGNAVDMAVGLILGASFGKIISSLVNDVIMPPVGMLLGKADFSSLSYELKAAVYDTTTKLATSPAVTINYGKCINTVLDFLIVAFCIFIVIRQMNRMKRLLPPPEPTTKTCPQCLSAIPTKAKRCAHCTSPLES
jgi:large conductance mechanosensitive channel